MNRVVIDKDRCKACEMCVSVCNKELIEISDELNAKGYHPVELHDPEQCTACGLCALVCPEGGIAVYKAKKAS
jgi:2-oxoglutarate ferredoxin oxidoreductase subunit delta